MRIWRPETITSWSLQILSRQASSDPPATCAANALSLPPQTVTMILKSWTGRFASAVDGADCRPGPDATNPPFPAGSFDLVDRWSTRR